MKYTKEYLKKNNITISVNSDDDKRGLSKIYNVFYPSNDMFYLRWNSEEDIFSWSSSILRHHFVVQASEVIAEYEANISTVNPKKIIGYIYPFKTINKHKVKDRSIVKKTVDDYTLFLDEISTTYGFPSEIVEQWEPVYEEVKPCFGSFDDLIYYLVKKGEKFESIKFGEETIDKSKFDFTPEFDQKLKDMWINV